MRVLQVVLSTVGRHEIPLSIARVGGSEVEVATMDDGRGEFTTAVEEVGCRVRVLGGRSTVGVVLALRRVLRSGDHDVVLAHGHHAGWALALAAYGLRNRPRTVVARHHNLFHHMIRNRARLAMDRLTIRWVDLMIATSASVGETLVSEGCPIGRMAYATNGRSWKERADPCEVATRRAIRSAKVRLASIGNLKVEKDHQTTVRALGRVVATGRDVDLFIAGTGSDAARRSLEQVAVQEGVGDRLVLGGWCSDPAAVMLAADAVVHASVDEASPQAVYEAAGLGVPVIATWAGGIRDILGRHQELLQPGDVDALAEAIMTVADDPAAARRRSENFAAEIRDRYGSEACGTSYLRACRFAVDRGPGHQGV